jgi:hypothetical protein
LDCVVGHECRGQGYYPTLLSFPFPPMWREEGERWVVVWWWR